MTGIWRLIDDLYQAPAAGVTAESLAVESIEVIWSLVPASFSLPTVLTPVPDDARGLSDKTLELLWAVANGLAGFRLLIVCRAGENRSGLAAALVLMARGLSVEQAIAQVQERGPATTHEHALWNPGFLDDLRRCPWDAWWPYRRWELDPARLTR